MALKSGLLSEGTWALDVLAVLLRDDTTVSWFGLQHMPGLVEVLLEHLRRCLIELFPGEFDDLEVTFEVSGWSTDRKSDDGNNGLLHGASSSSSSAAVGSQNVQVETNSPDEELIFDDKSWDVYGDVDSSMLDWQMGRGDITTHILTHFSHSGSLGFAGDRFFGQNVRHRCKSSVDRASKTVQGVGRTDSQRDEDRLTSNPVDQTTENFFRFSGSDAPGSKTDQFCSGSKAEASAACAAEAVSLANRVFEDPSSCSATKSLGSTAERSGTGSGAETVGSSETDRKPATGCRHSMCRRTQTLEDDDEDRKWLRLQLKRLWSDEGERHDDLVDDSDQGVLSAVGEDQQDTAHRCLALSNVIRGLSFVPGNDSELARHPGVVATLSRLFLFRHQHSRPASSSSVPSSSGHPGGSDVAEVLREDVSLGSHVAQDAPRGSVMAQDVLQGSNIIHDAPCGCGVAQDAPRGSEVVRDVLQGSDMPQDVLQDSYVAQDVLQDSHVAQDAPRGSGVVQDVLQGSDMAQDVLQDSHVAQDAPRGSWVVQDVLQGSDMAQDVLQDSHVAQDAPRGSGVVQDVLQASDMAQDVLQDSHVAQDAPRCSHVGQEALVGSTVGQDAPRCSHVAEVLREDALVTFANISGQLELESYPEEICITVLDGLLHWASCRAPCAVDLLPNATHRRDPVSAQRLALEALCKLCVTDSNVDLLLATPPFQRVVAILGNLFGAMANPDCDQVWREFAIVLASSLVAVDPGIARALALHRSTIPVLVGFVEEAAAGESTPGTSADMVRRATAVLRAVAELPEGRSELARYYQCRILQLAVSSALDTTVLGTFANILHICSAV